MTEQELYIEYLKWEKGKVKESTRGIVRNIVCKI